MPFNKINLTHLQAIKRSYNFYSSFPQIIHIFLLL